MARGSVALRTITVLTMSAVLTLGVAPGRASPPPSYVDGGGALADDWRDEPQLARGRVERSDLVGMWQAVLWADGYLPRSGVNCAYDAATAEATRVWQSNHGLDADGIVGRATFGFAGRRLALIPPWTVYQGEERNLPLRRASGGAYEVYDGGRFRALRRDAVTLVQCRRR
ncbi:peptidoglycan-binding domain-containing protein [Streptomyces sp. NPDC097640]|uniref:peptidoglycan-binding domain-containing protein n=1 Tax=Streptomyces sp. NPDC097640 TaxID=3157229 RepID=UPI00331D4A0D